MSLQIRLFFLGWVSLFLELLFIRFLPGNIWNLGYFPNLVLLAAFLGTGLGFILHVRVTQNQAQKIYQCLPLLLLSFTLLIYAYKPLVPGFSSHGSEIGGEVFFTDSSHNAGVGSYFSFFLWFSALVLIFSIVAQFAAKYFSRLAPLQSYTYNIAGSLAAILSFMVISHWQMPAHFWFPLFGIGFIGSMNFGSKIQFALTVGIFLVLGAVVRQEDSLHQKRELLQWSPYQKVELGAGPSGRKTISVNGIGHQEFLDQASIQDSFYLSPYRFRREKQKLRPYKKVLVIGSGCGNDILAALMGGATEIDAVEIDPAIASMGKKFHPDHPYSDPRVSLHVNDARSYLTNTQKHYDLILFALTDSMVKISPMAQLRLENYLFTQQSLRKAFELLNPQGNLVLYNFYRQPWLQNKMLDLTRASTGREPKVIWKAGDLLVFTVGTLSSLVQGVVPTRDLPSDDWPFLYLKEKGIPTLYIGAMGLMFTLVSLLMVYLARSTPSSKNAQAFNRLLFVLMGMAFLLLQTKSVIQFSLLFGTTWINSSLVFVASLISVLAATWVATRIHSRKILVGVGGLLLLSCTFPFLIPLAKLLLIEEKTLRFVAASVICFSPIFFANLLFCTLFKKQEAATDAFGWNMLGGTLGGVLEYTSISMGYTFLGILIFCLYLLIAALLLGRVQNLKMEFSLLNWGRAS